MTQIRDDRRYSSDHEWVLPLGGGRFRVGITDHAQEQLGDVVFVELPAPGKEIAAADPVGVVESVKAVSDIYSPLAGTIVAANQQLEGAPETVNSDPYEGGWIFEIQASDAAAYDVLLDAAAYAGLIA